MENRNRKKALLKKTAPILPPGSHFYAKLNYHANQLAFERIRLIHKNNQIIDNIQDKTRLLKELDQATVFLKGLRERETYPEKNEAEIRYAEQMHRIKNVKSRLEKLADDKQMTEVNLFLCEAQLEAYVQIGLIPTNFETPQRDTVRPE